MSCLLLFAGTQVDVTIWSIVEPSTGIISACLPIMGPLLRISITEVRSLSWFGRSIGISNHHGERSTAGQNDLPMPENPRPTVIKLAKSGSGSGSDEEMGLPLKNVEVVTKEASSQG